MMNPSDNNEQRRKKRKLHLHAKNALYALTTLFALSQLLSDSPITTTTTTSPRHLKGRIMTRKELHASDGHMSISRKNKLLYVHVPKTGGTTMERSSLFDDAREFHELGGHHPISQMLGNAKKRKLTRFIKAAHIRHPCDRFLSAYNYLQNSGNSGDRAFATQYNIYTLTIDQFLAQFNTDPEWHPFEIKHFVPQVEYVFYTHDGTNEKRVHAKDRPDGTFGLDVLMCTEQWEEGLERLEMALGGGGGGDVGDYNLVPEEIKTARENSLEHMTCDDLTPESRAIIERVYAMDYCVFDYPTSSSSLPLSPSAEESTCVGQYTTSEMFEAKYKECLMQHKPEYAAKKPKGFWHTLNRISSH